MVSSEPVGMSRIATEGNLTADADIRLAGVIEAEDVLFNLGRGSRRDVEIVLYLDLCRRHIISDERQCGGVHDGATLDGDDLPSCYCLTREKPAALDRAGALLHLRAEPATHERPPL